MDKYEYRIKTEQMLEYVKNKSYDKAMEIADTIDWKKVKNSATLCTVSEIYENNGDYQSSRDILFIAYDRAPGSRKIVYRLGVLALRLGDMDEASDCYEEFVNVAPKDPNQYILKYKILKAQKSPVDQQIGALEEFKKSEYIEKWAYELAKLYDKVGMTAECLEECDDLILWFSEGKYVYQAMELKMKYKPLTPLQKEKYDHGGDIALAAVPVPEPVVEVEDVLPEPPSTTKGVAEITAEMEIIPEEKWRAEEIPEPAVKPSVITHRVEGATLQEAVMNGVAMTGGIKLAEASAEKAEEIEDMEEPKQEGDLEITGQMRIEEILKEWETKQIENAKLIQEKKEAAAMQKEAAARENLNSKAAKAVEAVEPPEDIQKLMDEIELGVDPEAEKMETQEIELDEEFDDDEDLEAEDDDTDEAEEEIEEADEFYETAETIETDDEEFYDEEEPESEEKPIEEPIEDDEISQREDLAATRRIEIDDREIEDPMDSKRGKYDTGFIVQGRYDLNATSEIGLKAGLTEEQKQLFSYFVPVRGVSEQIVEVLENDKNCRSRYGTSRSGNLMIVGRKGSGKTVLAVDIVKAIQKQRKLKQGKVAIVTGEALNKKDLSGIVKKLSGGAIIIEKAGKLSPKKLKELDELMEDQTGELLFVLEEQRKPLDRLLATNPSFKKKFTSSLELPIFINDELVTFGQTYAKENGYRLDEMGILALYSRIDMMQREDHAVTVAEVKEIMDEAIEHSQKANVKHLMKRVFGKNTDDSDRIILKEQDFK